MNILSLNVRGLEGTIKSRYLKEIIYKEGIEMVCLQETKAQSINNKSCYAIWGDIDIE